MAIQPNFHRQLNEREGSITTDRISSVEGKQIKNTTFRQHGRIGFAIGMLNFVVLCAVLIGALLVTPAQATNRSAESNISVTNGDDSGPGSLRQAIADASSGDTITFDSGVSTVTLTSAQLTISTTLTIDGGTTGVTIARSDEAGTPDFRIFDITGGDVTLDSLAIRNGNVSDSNGGGIFNSGTLTVTNSILSGNQASDSGGGGIFNDGGTLTVTNSTVNGNTAGTDGGGIANNGTTAMVAVTNSILSGNTASNNDGGGIANNGGTLTVTNSTLSGNTAGFDGGGIDNNDELTVINSTLSGNTASDDGGGISNNDELTVINSTLSGNSSSDDGGGIDNKGNGTVNVTNSTLSGNGASGDGGGIFANSGTVTLANTIVANNTDRGGDNDVQNTASLTVLGNNIIEIAVSGTAADTTNGTINNTDPLLSPLQDNGGLTLTHLPLTGSPAIDAGDNTVATNAGLTTDQRGLARVVNTTVDMGAVEVGAGNITYFIALQPTSVIEGNSSDTIDATVTVTRTGGISATSSIDLALGGDADEGSDYTFALASGSAGSFDGTTLSFDAGETEASFTLTVQGDNVVEPDETVEVTLVNPAAPETATITGDNPVTLTIQDDEAPTAIYLPLIVR